MFNLHLVGLLESISGALCIMGLTQFSPTRLNPAGGLNLPTLSGKLVSARRKAKNRFFTLT